MDSSSGSDFSSFEYDHHPTPPVSPIDYSLLATLHPPALNLFPPLLPPQPTHSKPNRPAHYEKNKNLTPAELQEKHKERMAKNRLAAQESRDKKKNYLRNLESTNSQLLLQNQLLMAQVQGTENANKSLLEMVKTLSSQLAYFTSSTLNPSPDGIMVNNALNAPPFNEMLLPQVADYNLPNISAVQSNTVSPIIEPNDQAANDKILDEIFDFDPPVIPSPPLSDTTSINSSSKSIGKSTRSKFRTIPYKKPSLHLKNCSLITSEPVSYTSNIYTLLKESLPTKSDAITTTLITSLSFLALTTGSHYSNRHIFHYTEADKERSSNAGFCGKRLVQISGSRFYSSGMLNNGGLSKKESFGLVRKNNFGGLQPMMKAFSFVKRLIK